MELEQIVLDCLHPIAPLNRLCRRVEVETGVKPEPETVLQVVQQHGFTLPNRSEYAFEPEFVKREYVINWTYPDAIDQGPRSEIIVTVLAKTAKEALIQWGKANPDDPRVRLLDDRVRPFQVSKGSAGRHDRVDALRKNPTPPHGSPENLVIGVGIVTNWDEVPEATGRWLQRNQATGETQVLSYESYCVALSEKLVPDQWARLAADKGWWKRFRRLWGDHEASQVYAWLARTDLTMQQYRWWQTQRHQAIALLYERSKLSLEVPPDWEDPTESDPETIGLEKRFTWQSQRSLTLRAYNLDLQQHPDAQEGKRHLLPDEGFESARREALIATAPNDEAWVREWITWWQEVKNLRDEAFVDHLRKDVSARSVMNPSHIGFYGATQKHFRWFLFHQERFYTSPCRLPLDPKIDPLQLPLPKRMEAYLLKEGWEKARDLILIAFAAA